MHIIMSNALLQMLLRNKTYDRILRRRVEWTWLACSRVDVDMSSPEYFNVSNTLLTIL